MEEISYSFSLTTFSPTGNLHQIQHAMAAVNRGRASLGIAAENGVALICQRKQDETSEVLIDQSTVKLVEKVSDNIGITYSGLSADFRPILSLARTIAVMYKSTYKQDIPVKMLAKQLSSSFQENTQQGGVRPFGCSILIAGSDINDVEEATPVLYQVDPSGSYFKLKAWANGKNNEQIRQQLEKRYQKQELDDAIVQGLGMLKEACDVELGAGDIAIGVIKNGKFQILSAEVVAQYYKNVE